MQVPLIVCFCIVAVRLVVGEQSANSVSAPFKCPPCKRMHCLPKRRCRGGFVKDLCGCCEVCAKVQGERCGGAFNYLGVCDRGLFCEAAESKPMSLKRFFEPPKGTPEGTCQPEPPMLADQPSAPHCAPRCTADYCHNRTAAVCSAAAVAVRTLKCQAPCQHTVCAACRFERDCPKCRKDHLRCLRQFAQCVRKDFCQRKKTAYAASLLSAQSGRFVCQVPDCLL